MDQLFSYAAGTFLLLFPITNPLGAVPTFYSLTASSTPLRRSHQARQVAINVVVILTAALFIGRFILDFFGIPISVLRITGGPLLARTAWIMSQSSGTTDQERLVEREDKTLIPSSIPRISDPSAIGSVISLAAKNSSIFSTPFGKQYEHCKV